MSQIAALTAANVIAQLTLPLIKSSVVPQYNKGQASTTPSPNIDTVSISAKAAALQSHKK